MNWDVFISYASEDRDAVVLPLAMALKNCGCKVWYDRTELHVGDSLRRKIDEGLSLSRYGVVVLSPAFFKKEFPQRELDGLANRESDGGKVVLPIWHDVDVQQVRSFSPILADRIAARWSDGIMATVASLLSVIHPRSDDAPQPEGAWRDLNRLQSGAQIGGLLPNADASALIHDDLLESAEVEMVGGFLEGVHGWIDLWMDMGPLSQAQAEFEWTQAMRDLERNGWSVWGGRETIAYKMRNPENKVEVIPMEGIVIAVVRGEPTRVLRTKDGVIVVRPSNIGMH